MKHTHKLTFFFSFFDAAENKLRCNEFSQRHQDSIVTLKFVEELSLKCAVSEGMKEQLSILLLTRVQGLTAQRNHTVL